MEVHLNDEKLCVAGVGSQGGLSNQEHLMWVNRPLKVGDEIRVRVIETDSVDTPVTREPNP